MQDFVQGPKAQCPESRTWQGPSALGIVVINYLVNKAFQWDRPMWGYSADHQNDIFKFLFVPVGW